MRLFDELSHLGLERCRALSTTAGGAPPGLVEAFCRLAHAVRLAVVVAMRLDQILSVLADLRRRGVADAGARGRAKTDEVAAVREQAGKRC